MEGKLVHAKNDYLCTACEKVIEKDQPYISQSGACSDGTFATYKVCFECGFLITQKTGERRNRVSPGEMTEKKIPNFLRKLRDEYRKDPQGTCLKYWKEYNEQVEKEGKIFRKTLRVSREMYNRKIINVPLKTSLKELKEGQELKLIKGFNEEDKIVKIKKICFTRGQNFTNCKAQKAVGILIEDAQKEA
jgi:hypothetical protein